MRVKKPFLDKLSFAGLALGVIFGGQVLVASGLINRAIDRIPVCKNSSELICVESDAKVDESGR